MLAVVAPRSRSQMFVTVQVESAAHAPQFATVRAWPQLSVPLFEPHVAPRRVQNAASVSAVHPHTFATLGVAPPQLCPVPVHVPQLATFRTAPQLSVVVSAPQFLEPQSCASVCGVQPHTFAVPPPPHVTPVPLQLPQLTTLREAPHKSVAVIAPQFFPSRWQSAASVSLHPHTFATPPPPQLFTPVHAPQFGLRAWPQLSVAWNVPQFLEPQSCASVCGVQPAHTLPLQPYWHEVCAPDAHAPPLHVLAAVATPFAQLAAAHGVSVCVYVHCAPPLAPEHVPGPLKVRRVVPFAQIAAGALGHV
jgi:hypothetical protein